MATNLRHKDARSEPFDSEKLQALGRLLGATIYELMFPDGVSFKDLTAPTGWKLRSKAGCSNSPRCSGSASRKCVFRLHRSVSPDALSSIVAVLSRGILLLRACASDPSDTVPNQRTR